MLRSMRIVVPAIVAVTFLVLSPIGGAGQPAGSSWTVSEARGFLLSVSGGLAVTDASQPDRPGFRLRFQSSRQLRVTPLGKVSVVAAKRRWRQFSVSGLAHDVLTDEDLSAKFTFSLLPAGSTPRYRVTGFRGPAPDTSQPAFPIRATAFYAWYPEGWTQFGITPFTWYQPSLGYYRSDDPAVIRQQIQAMLYANIAVGLYSWWTPHTGNQSPERFPLMLRMARQTPFRWAIYYEPEGYGNPSVNEIQKDLIFFRDTYAAKPSFLKVNGRFVVFVYRDGADGCEMADRWKQANTVNAYIVLFAFPGYLSCPSQPDSWHAYSPTEAESTTPPAGQPGPLNAFMISPGFNAHDNRARVLDRNLERWRRNIQDMVASRAPWQLVLTFNEWAEGTAVESGTDWTSPSGYGAYLDALHEIE